MIRIISDAFEAFITDSVISGFLKLIDDYNVLEKLGVRKEEN